MSRTFAFPRLGADNIAAKVHDSIASALERALLGIEATPENARIVVTTTAATMMKLCVDHNIDPTTVFAPELVRAVFQGPPAKKD
jgi:hypothetical protein